MTFGEKLKEARLKAGMTQDELAAAVYTTKTAISRYEHNKRVPNGKVFVRLAIVLGYDFDMFQMANLAGISGDEFHTGVDAAFDWFDRVLNDENHPIYKGTSTVPEEQEAQDTLEVELLNIFTNKLNHDGKLEALKRLDELAQIPKYKRRNPQKNKPSGNGSP